MRAGGGPLVLFLQAFCPFFSLLFSPMSFRGDVVFQCLCGSCNTFGEEACHCESSSRLLLLPATHVNARQEMKALAIEPAPEVF